MSKAGGDGGTGNASAPTSGTLPAAAGAPPLAEARTALITGACSGIGLEIARELARRGHPVVLVSDREPELATAGAELAAAHHVPTHVIPMDLARAEAAGALYEELRRRGLEIDILVSNAGMLMFGEVADASPERANALLQLHVVTPSLLARYLGHDMRARRRGHILFVSSISALRDFPGIAYYGSSKRYLLSFANSLREELRTWGVHVTCLAPGATATGLYSSTAAPVARAVRYRLMTDPARVARTAVDGMFKGKALVVPGLGARAMGWGMRLTPRWLIRLARERSGLLPVPKK